jgi:YVTN family beta-propeller protein
VVSTRVAALTIALLVGCSAQDGSPPTGSPPVASLSPTPSLTLDLSAIKASIPIAHESSAIAAGPEGVWVLAPDGHVLHIDPGTETVVADIAIAASEFGHIAVGTGGVWVTDFDHDSLTRIDPTSNKVVANITVGKNPEGLLVTPDTVWVSNHRGGSISKVEISSNTVSATYSFGRTGKSGPKDIVMADGDLWTSVPNMTAVFRIDASDGTVVKKLLVLSEDVGNLMTDGTSVYVPARPTLLTIDPSTNAVVQEQTPEPFPFIFGRSSFWTLSGNELVRLDPNTLAPTARWALVDTSSALFDVPEMVITDDAIWLIAGGRIVLHVEVEP